MQTFNYRVRSNNFPAKCGVEVIDFDAVVLAIVADLPDNQGISICNAFEDLVPQVANSYGVKLEHLVWVEHWLPRHSYKESFDLVLFNIIGNRVTSPWWIPLNHSCWQQAQIYFQEFYPTTGLVALQHLWISHNLI